MNHKQPQQTDAPGIRPLDQTCTGQIISSGDHVIVLIKSFKGTKCLFQRTQNTTANVFLPHQLLLEVSLSSFTSSVPRFLCSHRREIWARMHFQAAKSVSWRQHVFTSRTNNGCRASSHSVLARPEALPTSDPRSLGSIRSEDCTDRLEEHDKATLLRNE